MKTKELVLAVAIMVLTIFVTFYGINTIFPKADYEDFCGARNVVKLIETETECVDAGGAWTPEERQCVTEPCPQGYCDLYSQCNADYENANKIRSQKVFYIALPLGILIITLGSFVFGLEVVGTGLIGGGIGTLIYGSGAFWPYTENWVRFLLSLLGLVILIWLIYYFSKKDFRKK